MSTITLTAASWVSYLAQTTAQARAGVVAGWFPSGATIEFYDGSDTLIRTVTTAAWTVGAAQGSQYPVVPGVYTDAGTGAGTVSYAVFKDGSTERFRCTCGVAANNFYRLLANFSSGVKLKRGNFAILVGPPPAVGNSEPVNTVAPSISGTAAVGQVLTCTPGAWTGNPVPTVTRQWYRGAAAIAGATGLAYTLASADVGAIITVVETATNVVGPRTATSNALGPVSSGALAFTPPAQVNISQGGVYDLSQHVAGGVPPYGNYAVDAGALPTGVTLDASSGVLSAAVDATVALSGDIDIGVDDAAVAPSPGALPTFSVLSAVGGTNLPFAFGHAFDQGDVPAGQFVNSDLADWQAVPTTYWPDGSLRHAIIAGRATCSAAVLKPIALSASGTNRSGTALTEADLAAAMPTVTLVAGGDSFTLNSLIGTAARHRTVCAGPVMSNWLYRRQIAGSNHLVAWFDVRLYIGGAVEIMPWVENGYLTVANPLNDSRTYTLTIGGVQKFSRTLDIKHHTRVALIDNSASSFKYTSYWTGTDPQIEPKHDIAYLRATKMVFNYTIPPSEATLSNTGEFPQSFTPNWLGTTKAAMASTGYGNHIGPLPNWAAGYVASGGDARAYRAVIANGLAAGSWPMHFRAEATSTQGTTAGVPNEPILYSVYPNVSIDWGGSPTVPPGSGGNNVDGVGTQAAPDRAHQPSLSYLPWLLTGRWFFLDETLFWVTWCYLKESNYSTRGGAKGLWFDGQVRSRAWHARSHAQLLAILPATHPCFNDMKYVWEQNMAELVASYVTGTRDSGLYANNLGVIGLYSGATTSPYGTAGDLWWDAPWMQDMWACALGMAWDMDVPQSSTSKTLHQTLKAHAFKHSVGMAGGSGATEHSYRYFGEFETAYGGNSGGLPLETWMADWGASLAARKTYGGGAGSGPLPDLPYAEPASVYYGQNPVTADMWAWHSAVAFHLGALTIAKEHGAAGADAAYARVTGATNYSTDGFNTYSIWSFTPRSA